MLAGLGRAVRSGWPRGKRQPPVLRGRRERCPLPSAPRTKSTALLMAVISCFTFGVMLVQILLKRDPRRGSLPLMPWLCQNNRMALGLAASHGLLSLLIWQLGDEKINSLINTLLGRDEVTINYRHGLPVITLLLPTRSERCRFTVKPTVTTVGAFLQDVQREDKGIERAEAFATDGSKVSDATLMEVLLMNDFKLVINNTEYSVSPPVKDKLSSEHATEMEDIKSLVHRLFVALHLEDHQIRKERELLQKLDHLKEELLPLEQMKARITDSADAKTSRLLWVGLALMSTQGGALAWLTWWVYSWDIMEPVTYFITYGSAMAFYAYFVLTKQDYIYPAAKDRQFLHYFYRKSKTQHFNVERYNKLKEDLAEAEESLRRLRQPLHLRLPIQEISAKD